MQWLSGLSDALMKQGPWFKSGLNSTVFDVITWSLVVIVISPVCSETSSLVSSISHCFEFITRQSRTWLNRGGLL